MDLAGQQCPDGYDIDRDDGRSMEVACRSSTPTATATHRMVSSHGLRFELPREWEEKQPGMWFSPDETSAVVADATQSTVDADEVANQVMANADERWDGTVHGRHVVFVTGDMRGSAAGMRVTRAVTVVDGRAYALTCAHRGTKAVSKVCMRILNSMRVE